MTPNSPDYTNKALHPQARSLAKEIVDEFASDLLLQAKILAKKDELVLSSHIKEALQIINKKQNRSWMQELLILIGGIFAGTFIQGFISEISKDAISPFWIACYVIMGFIGIIMIFIGFIRQYTS